MHSWIEIAVGGAVVYFLLKRTKHARAAEPDLPKHRIQPAPLVPNQLRGMRLGTDDAITPFNQSALYARSMETLDHQRAQTQFIARHPYSFSPVYRAPTSGHNWTESHV